MCGYHYDRTSRHLICCADKAETIVVEPKQQEPLTSSDSIAIGKNKRRRVARRDS